MVRAVCVKKTCPMQTSPSMTAVVNRRLQEVQQGGDFQIMPVLTFIATQQALRIYRLLFTCRRPTRK